MSAGSLAPARSRARLGLLRLSPPIEHVALLATIGAIFTVALAPGLDTDLWWHLRAGAYMTAHHAVPSRDFLSFTATGRAWTDHEWLSELLLYALNRAWGLWGPVIFFAGVITATYFLVARSMLRLGVHPQLAPFVVFACAVPATVTWGARPQMLTLLLLAAYGYLIARYRTAPNPRLLAWFPFLMVLWVNLHGGWVLGMALLVLAVIGETLNLLTGAEAAPTGSSVRRLALATAATALATVCNPIGLQELLYPAVWILPTAYSNALTEWVSPDYHMPVLMVFEALFLLLLASIFIARPRPNWANLLIILAFTYLALSEVRNVAVWSVVVAPLVAVYVQAAIVSRFPIESSRARREPTVTRALVNAGAVLLIVCLYFAVASRFITPVALRLAENGTFPAGAARYMATHRLGPRVFASYAWSGYVLWRTPSRYRDFIDGRANTLFDDHLLHDYIRIHNAGAGWDTLLRRYRVNDVLVEPASPVAAALLNSPDWHPVYRNRVAVLFAERPGISDIYLRVPEGTEGPTK